MEPLLSQLVDDFHTSISAYGIPSFYSAGYGTDLGENFVSPAWLLLVGQASFLCFCSAYN
jgi:hypothetical protein